jgi:hypothetical protein
MTTHSEAAIDDIPLAGSEAGLSVTRRIPNKRSGPPVWHCQMRLSADTAAYACREYYKVELTGYRRVPRRRMVQ